MDTIRVPLGGKKTKVEPPKRKRKKWPFQGYIDFQGLKIDLENKKGSVRRGTSPEGKKWTTYMHHHYGEIRGTRGADNTGDALDCYVGPNADSPLVIVVHQQDPKTRKYDEDKVMLGFDSADEALKAYRGQYDGPGYYQDHTTLNIGQFWRWVHDKRQKGKKVKEAEESTLGAGLAVGTGVGTGVGLRGYYTHKGLWEGINQELAGKMGALADDAEKIYRAKMDKGILRRFVGKRVFGPSGPPLSKLRGINLGTFPFEKFQNAAIKGGLAAGIPTALGTMLAMRQMRPRQREKLAAAPSTRDLLKAYEQAAKGYYDVINKTDAVKRTLGNTARKASRFFGKRLPVLQGGVGLGAGGLAGAGAAYAAPDTKYDIPAAAAAGVPVGIGAALLAKNPMARMYLKHMGREITPVRPQLAKLWNELHSAPISVDYRIEQALKGMGKAIPKDLGAAIRNRASVEGKVLRRKLTETGDLLGDLHAQHELLRKRFGAK